MLGSLLHLLALQTAFMTVPGSTLASRVLGPEGSGLEPGILSQPATVPWLGLQGRCPLSEPRAPASIKTIPFCIRITSGQHGPSFDE